MWGSVVHIRMAVTHPYTNSSQIASDYYFNQWRSNCKRHQNEYSEVTYEMPAHHQNTLGDRNTPWQDFMKDIISSFWLRNSCSCNLLWLASRSVSDWISFSLADWMAVKHSSVISTFKTVASARVTARQNAKTVISMLSVAAFIAITISAPSLRAFSTFWMLSCKLLIACLRSWSSLSRLAN